MSTKRLKGFKLFSFVEVVNMTFTKKLYGEETKKKKSRKCPINCCGPEVGLPLFTSSCLLIHILQCIFLLRGKVRS